jgi:dGTP triphosphohydrolase
MAEHRTSFNTPIPQWQPPAPEDPTASPLVVGGALKLNDHDRAGFSFRQSFMNQFEEGSWFTRDWIPELFEPLHRTINDNFDKALDLIDKSSEDVLALREEVLIEVVKVRKEIKADIVKVHDDVQQEMKDWVNTKNKEFTDEVAELRRVVMNKCNSDLNVMRDDLLRVLRKDMADEIRKMNAGLVKTRDAETSDRIEETVQAIKTATDTTRSEMMTTYNADVQSIHAEILQTLRQELAQEILKMREATK